MHKLNFNFTKNISIFAIVLLAILFFSQFFTNAEAAIGINRQINFQGKLVNNPLSTNVSDTSYTVVFTLYDRDSGGTVLWQETQSVSTTDGIFRVALGSVTPFPANFNFNWSGLYLGIKVNADAEMTPRIQMAAVPFAFNSEKVAGLTVQDTSGNASTSGTLQIANAKTVSFADAFTTSGAFPLTLTTTGTTNATIPSGTVTLVDLSTTQSLTNKTIGSTGLTFSGATTDVTTASNEDLTLSPNGSGNIILTGDFNSQVLVGGSGTTTEFPFFVNNGIGNNAAFVVSNLNNGDLFSASASGVTKFTVSNAGLLSVLGGLSSDIDTLTATTLKIGTSTTNAITLGNNTVTSITMNVDTAGNFVFQKEGVSYTCSGTDKLTLNGSGQLVCGTDQTGAGTGVNWWNQLAGALSPVDTTNDFLLGSTATSSALFSYTGIKTGQTIASVSGSLIVMPNNGYGNVGIGTTNPNYPLVVKSGTAGFAFDALNQNWGTLFGSGGNFGIYAESPGSVTGGYLQMGGSTRGDAQKNAIIFGINNTEYMRIDGNFTGHTLGNVGIGTTTPSQKLHLIGSMQIQAAGGDGSTNLISTNATNWLSYSAFGGHRFVLDSDSSNVAGDDFEIYNSAISGIPYFSVEGDSGNVGIGTILPTAPLHINTGYANNAAFIVNNLNNGNLIAGSSSGTTKFVVGSSGNVSIAASSILDTLTAGTLNLGTSTANALVLGNNTVSSQTLNVDTAGNFVFQKEGVSYTCSGTDKLTLNGSGQLVCSADVSGTGGTNWWNQLAGALSPLDTTNDFLLGSTATSSALFSYTGIKTGQTIASVSGSLIVMPNNGYGNVGIGTTTPNQALDVRGSSIFGNQQAGDVTGQPNRSKIIYANQLTTETSTDIFATAGELEVNPAGATSRIYYGGLYHVQSTSGNAQNFTGRLVGFQGQVNHHGTATLTQARGFAGLVINDNSGTITDSFGGRFGNSNTSTGAITNGYGVYAIGGVNSAGGTFLNNYGVYIEDQSNAGSTSNYNIYSAGGGSHNYFAGNLGIGTTTVGNGQLVINQTNFAGSNGNIFSASTSGVTKFTIANNGDVAFTGAVSGVTTLAASGAIAANGGITFDQATDTLGAFTMAGNIIGGSFIITDIGSTGTDFDTSGGLNITTDALGTALTVDNAANASSIFVAEDNNVSVFTIADGGNITMTGTLAVNGDSITADGATLIINAAGAVDIQDGLTVDSLTIDTGDVSWTSTTPTITIAAAETFQITNGTAADNFTYNTSTNALTIGDGTNGLTFDIDTGMLYQGSGRPTKTITLSPEYAGAIISASGSASTTGSMTSDASPSASFRTYYEWTSTQTSLQDYTIAIRVTLPSDFSAWTTSSTTMQVNFNTGDTSALANKLDVFVYNPSTSTSTPVVYRQAMVSGTDKTWATVDIANTDLEDSPAWSTAGQTAIIYLKLYGSGTYNYTQVGDITLNYLAKF